MVNLAIIWCNNDRNKSSIKHIFSCQRNTKDKKIIERMKYGYFLCSLYRGRFQTEPGGNNLVDNH